MRKTIFENDILSVFKKRLSTENKSDFGYVALIGGSEDFSGAVRLSLMGLSSLRAGAGVSRIVIPESIRDIVGAEILENTLMTLPEENGKMVLDAEKLKPVLEKSKVISFGMGVGISEGTEEVLKFLLENFERRLLIDADGLTMLSKFPESVFEKTKAKLILTPHHGEFLRLLNGGGSGNNAAKKVVWPEKGVLSSEKTDVADATEKKITLETLQDPEKRMTLAENYAKKHRVILLLKGAETLVTDGETTYISKTGCPGMATAGSGDVLTGVLTGVLGYAEDLLLGTAAGTFVTGRAGEEAEKETGSIAMISSDTVKKIPVVMKRLEDLRDRNGSKICGIEANERYPG